MIRKQSLYTIQFIVKVVVSSPSGDDGIAIERAEEALKDLPPYATADEGEIIDEDDPDSI